MTAGTAFGANDEDDAPAKPAVPNIYLDLRTTYATSPSVPAGIVA